MSIYKLFGTDPDLERNGIALEYGDVTFIIARAGGANRKFQSCVERVMRPYRSALASGTMDPETADRRLAECYAEAIILAWEGVTDENGEELPFTKENVVKVLLDLPDLFANIQEESQRLSNYIRAEADEVAKT